MAIRVALFGTGNCGQIALLQLIEDPRFEVFGDVELARAWMALSR